MVIIQFNKFLRQRKKNKKMEPLTTVEQEIEAQKEDLQSIINKARDDVKKNKQISFKKVDEIARDILNNIDGYDKKSSTPIVSLADQLGFRTFHQKLKKGLSGIVKIDEDLKEEYGTDKVIAVNYEDSLEHLRFVIAHEIGHYIFEYDGISPKYSNTYQKNMHITMDEIIANRFAAELLMPKDLFIEQYKRAKNIINDRRFIIIYLSKYFKTSYESINKRIMEVI